MRTALIIAALILAPTSAFATCIQLPTTEDRAENLTNERALALCRAQELHDATARTSQLLQFQADLQAQQQNFDLQLKLQRTYAAASTPPTLPTF